MKLLEIIPGAETKKELVDFMVKFGEEVLGKGIVLCKDVPNFVGNRIGVYDISNIVNIMIKKGLKVEEIDAIVGKALGRQAPPSSEPRFGRPGYGLPRHEEPL